MQEGTAVLEVETYSSDEAHTMSTEVAEQSTVLMDVISSRRIEGCFIVSLTSALIISVVADWYNRVTFVAGTMAERFLIDPKSEGKLVSEMGLRMMTGGADGVDDGTAARSANGPNSSGVRSVDEMGSKTVN